MLSFFLANIVPEKITEARQLKTHIEAERMRQQRLYVAPPYDQDSFIDNLPDIRGGNFESSILVLNELVGMEYIGE